ncbi:4'-phosphopantetheinyl transferase superfamily protein [Streptomyces sp. NPDC049099]|uniref:4'-phosphopantetheinyl transferase family protein n=1 Tax=Streptomyces sp. NPDC049099 TaxID=3155768 RepID=UPI00343C03F1
MLEDVPGALDGVDLRLVGQPRPGAGAVAADLALLDESERRRAARFRRVADRDLYVAVHLALRRALAGYLGLPPQDVVLVREPCPGCGGPHGRPAVAGAAGALHFSLSHSHGLALIALAAVPVGADIQRLPGPDTVEVCSAALHPAERAELAAVPEPERPAAFARLWSRKEAYLKGLGIGLARPAHADYLGDTVADRPRGWTVGNVPCGPGHAAAVALRGPHLRNGARTHTRNRNRTQE